MEFAAEYSRTDEGWIIFPDDVGWRKQTFPSQVFRHYAKMQMYLEQEIIRFVSQPGDIILDPMAGTGTIMLAALMGRPVVCMDIEEGYHIMQQEVLEHLQKDWPDMAPVILLHGNSKLLLPFECNHIIFSPPYASALKPGKELSKFVSEKYRIDEEQYHMYAQATGNVGLLNTFLYNQNMEKVYKLCYESLKPNGTMTVITKDLIRDRKRVYLSKWVLKVCKQIGFELVGHHKHLMMGGAYQDVARSKGEETVDDEDIIIYRRI